jgi:rfaE bifunctional protein nucleotidyltransferase chain/domain
MPGRTAPEATSCAACGADPCPAIARFVRCQSREPSPTIWPVNFRDKILSLDALPGWRSALRVQGRKLVVTNGCFDILHAGHVTYLDAARQQGDSLLVGLNSDASVRLLKGENRPVNAEGDRAAVLAALQAVDAVCIFPDLRATRFLALAQPDIYVKGGDFTVDELPREERDVVAAVGGRIVTIGFVPGKSTTALVEKISSL